MDWTQSSLTLLVHLFVIVIQRGVVTCLLYQQCYDLYFIMLSHKMLIKNQHFTKSRTIAAILFFSHLRKKIWVAPSDNN